MSFEDIEKPDYCIMDPTGNITALVESRISAEEQPLAAAAIMRKHPEVEQVGFVSFDRARDDGDKVRVTLRMAGGEFCGNASMSAAALYLIRKEQSCPDKEDMPDEAAEETVCLKASGAASPVEVRLKRNSLYSYRACVHMPEAVKIEDRLFEYNGVSGELPCICMEGISHLIIECGSEFYELLKRKDEAEEAVKAWCESLGADGLGLMFLDKNEEGSGLIPLVYVPGSSTVFWENSCASGSAAAGMYLASKNRSGRAEVLLREPGGMLKAVSDREAKETWLYGKTEMVTDRGRAV